MFIGRFVIGITISDRDFLTKLKQTARKSSSLGGRNTTLQHLYELELHKINRLLLLFSVFEFYFQPFPCFVFICDGKCSCLQYRLLFDAISFLVIVSNGC
uniref:(northern house mosquito) hypothetical protein n=1 Tax=Culex pipiens TaxID=7175 RepID=A0A8D8I053_CULPI